jgi:thioredoxin 1
MQRLDKVTTDTFGDQVLGSELPVLVEFTTSGCPACHAARPALESLAEEFDGRARIVEVNVEEERELGGLFQIRAVPTLAFFKNGEFVDGVVGAPAPAVLRRRLDEITETYTPRG